VAVLVICGYVLFTRAGRSEAPGGTFTPFQSATPFRPAPPGNVLVPRPPGAPRQLGGGAGAPPFPYAPRPGNGPSMPLPIGREMAVVDLNAASLAELETLPDITPDYARKIITGRPYQSMSDLERAGIPRKIVENISPPAIIRLTQRGSPPPDVASKPGKTP
jgi:Helix-hairpin-helix motif